MWEQRAVQNPGEQLGVPALAALGNSRSTFFSIGEQATSRVRTWLPSPGRYVLYGIRRQDPRDTAPRLACSQVLRNALLGSCGRGPDEQLAVIPYSSAVQQAC